MLEEGIVQRRENALLVLAEIVARYEIQGGPGLGLVLVVPMRVVPAAALIDLRSARETQYSGTNMTFNRPRTAGSPSTVQARLLRNLMMSFAR